MDVDDKHLSDLGGTERHSSYILYYFIINADASICQEVFFNFLAV